MECVIDELKICYTADKEQLDGFMNVEAGGRFDIPDFRLYRIINDKVRYCYDVVHKKEKVAQLRFGFYTDTDDSENYVLLKVLNPVLYDRALLTKVMGIPDYFGLVCNNYTALDLAIDTHFNVPSFIKKMMRCKEVTTIINGKAIKDRKAVLPELLFEYSSSLDRLRHPSITVKQKKALYHKNEGITVQAYDKHAEVINHSGKQYILDYYGNPLRLYRLEVRLRYQELKDYLKLTTTPATTDLIFNQPFLLGMFYYHLESVIRFTKGRRKIQWKQLLECNGRV